MRLLVLLLCLSHGQAFQCSTSPYSNQIPKYTVCPDDNLTESPHNDLAYTNDCDYVSTMSLTHCDSPDHDSQVALCWRLRDPSRGTVEVVFPLLPQRCNFTGYDVTLMVHEAGECSNAEDEFKKHSKKEIAIEDCMEASCVDKCSQNGSVVFRHVFSGCYQLYLLPRRHYQALQELVSEPLVIDSPYTKTPVSTLRDPLLSLEKHNDGLSLQAQLVMSPASSHITLSHGINTSMGHHACRNTGVPLTTCATCLGSPEIQCTSGSSISVTPACSYQGESMVRCKFSGLKPGNYCIRIQFDDDRCVANTIWDDDDNYSACTWEVFQQFLPVSEPPLGEAESRPSTATVNPFLVTLLVLAVAAMCCLAGFIVYRRMLPNYPQFLPVRHKPLHIPERPVILLLYARDCPSFMQAVQELRTIMRRLYNCQVMDCWEDSQYEAVAQSPARWLLSLLTNSRVRCVLVTSPASVMVEAGLVHNTAVRHQQPRAFDCVLTHALTSLHETSSQDSYNRLFVVRLDTGAEGVFPKVRTYLNPLTTYVLPVHLNKLMATLHNLDSAVCTITANGQIDVAPLTDAISEYRRYLRENPQYLDTLLVTEQGTSLQHVLT